MAGLRVLSWPGYGAAHNPFVTQFLDGLAAAGCQVHSAETVEDIATAPAVDIVLLHWAERVFAEARGRGEILVKMRRLLRALDRHRGRHRDRQGADTKVVWLAHNLAPHNARRLARLLWPPYIRRLIRRVDGVMTLSPGTLDVVREAYPALAGRPGIGLWHPTYDGAALSAAERAAARGAQGWNDGHRVLGYCGQIRPYKGGEDLLRVFRQTPGADLRLLLAGIAAPDYATHLRAMAKDDTRITLMFKDLPPADYRAALGACDVVAAPLRSYLHSGSILHALSAERPVLTPRTAFSTPLGAQLGPEWMHLYDGALTPDHLLNAARAPRPAGPPDLTDMTTQKVAAQAAEFFRAL